MVISQRFHTARISTAKIQTNRTNTKSAPLNNTKFMRHLRMQRHAWGVNTSMGRVSLLRFRAGSTGTVTAAGIVDVHRPTPVPASLPNCSLLAIALRGGEWLPPEKNSWVNCYVVA